MQLLFLAQCNQYGYDAGGGVSWGVAMVKSHYFLAKCGCFAPIKHQIGPLIQRITALGPFCPSPGSLYRSNLVESRIQWPSTFRRTEGNSTSSEHVSTVNSTVSAVPLSLMCTSGYMFRLQSEKTQKLLCITLRQRQQLLWTYLTVALPVQIKESRPIASKALMLKVSCGICPTKSLKRAFGSDILCALNWRSANTRTWNFDLLSSVEPILRHLGVAHKKPTCDHVETR